MNRFHFKQSENIVV